MADKIDYARLYRIAKQYYIENKSEDQIAKFEFISRPHVSRLLTQAKELGVVKIEVNMIDDRDTSELEEQLKQKLNLKYVKLAQTNKTIDSSVYETSKNVATAASLCFDEMFGESTNIGVGWGQTVYLTSQFIHEEGASGKYNFIPLTGSSGENLAHLQPNIITNNFARNTRSKSFFTGLSSFYENEQQFGPKEREMMESLNNQWETIDSAIIGICEFPNKRNSLISEFDSNFLNALEKKHAKGDLLSWFFKKDGSIIDTSEYRYQVCYKPEKLTKLARVACVAGGIKKAEAISIGAKWGYFNMLVTDTSTAKIIIDNY